jgi:drug/metabolite transporter (DMT)-like permease
MRNRHTLAVAQALFVTVLWSTSWVFITIGLEDIPALTFAGLRYTLAFLVLLPFALRGNDLKALRGLDRRGWLRLVALGLVYYAVTQGAQFLALVYVPATMVSLLLSFTAVVTALLSSLLLREHPTWLQWGGIALSLAGVVVYFWGLAPGGANLGGVLIGIIGMLANSVSGILGRAANRGGELSPTAVTVASMGIGSVVLLGGGLAVQGLPALSLTAWGYVVWLAVVSSALAFTLWNASLRTLSATESSVINNTMLIQIALLAWLVLGEMLTARQVTGLALAAAGTLIVQLRGARA